MSKQKLVMKYHPAKKEIEFHRFQSGKEEPIRNDSRLKSYMNEKGRFVLQDYGNKFFDDIAKAFDGLKSVDIDVITTKLDYEDFVQMTEYYNEGSACEMKPTPIAELPDMNQTFLEVVKHGKESIAVLHEHRQKLFEIPLENENVKKSAENFAQQIDGEIRNIKEKIESLDDNNVSLCFAGVYNSGKSTLINAILGYRILPESVESKTAKMFQISSPKAGERIRIIFDITNILTELEWHDAAGCFEFTKGPLENSVREDIQNTLNEIKGKRLKQHEQINKLLDKLNDLLEISSFVQIKFPVPLDNDKVQFTIYDTPGTDSNYVAHKNVLIEALEEQRQSILIFVAKPDGLEGEGNNALLNYLKKAEKKSKTSIDIGRSLFVINKAENQSAESRVILQQQEIKNKDDDNFSIKLSDKKLFFTSAMYAYAAKAVKNGIARPDEIGLMEASKSVLMSEMVPLSYCYRQNRCATSDFASKVMLEKCEAALKEARENNDSCKELEICSGLYALESEIVTYGEKYASAVKAFSIIDSVDKALSKLRNHANSLKDSNQEEICDLENNIEELRKTITEAIENEHNKMALPQKQPLSEEIRKKLGIDSDTLQRSVIGHTKDYLSGKIKGWFLGRGQVRFKEKDKDIVGDKIEQVIDDFTRNFCVKRKVLLEESRDKFMDAVKKTIAENGNISESAKQVFQDIPEPQVRKPKRFTDLGAIYDSHKRVKKVLWIEQQNLDKEGFIQDIEKKLLGVAREMTDDYGEDYRRSLDSLLAQIESIFKSNLDIYSLSMKALIEDKEAMKKLGDRLADAALSLERSQKTLNEMIWKELKENE